MFIRSKLIQIVFAGAALFVSVVSDAKDDFTLNEQQQINIETPGLFSYSDAFTVDFAGLRDGDYCFPLPVGKAKLVKDNFVEISTSKGDAVKAMFGGVVRMSRHHPTYGNVIVLRHDNGLETVYARNAQNMVAVGNRVKAGQTIAIVGNTDGTGMCLFAIMVNGGRINPGTLLGLRSHRLFKQTILCRKSDGHVDMSVVSGGKNIDVADDSFYKRDPFGGKGKFVINLSDLSPDEWCYPLQGAKVISNYGSRGRRSHTGVDIKTKANDKILAAFDGVVTMSQRYAAYGNLVRIRHANGLETYYSHNSKNLVKTGERVRAGQVIALTGQTGRATTPHLHFECRVNGSHFDPGKIFDHANHSLRMDMVTFVKRGASVSVRTDRNYLAKGK
ncbi:M23 family metallopeptidase [Xylanibacter muris]|uniref:M23 family metallopeptidase n=1 Tax=Xylanibacter muris TaxID=2736290 RepID=A0ABX2AL52_9BACT|nr:M23 family metallopeptidase [Xylanibacter muris]NPD91921.1 M23 family metallopeptidase [Xylanibacter muris]